MNTITEYIVHLNPNRIVVRGQWLHKSRYYSQAQLMNMDNLSDNQKRSKLSGKSKSKIIAAVSWLSMSSVNKWVFSKQNRKSMSFRLAFLTLTIPECTNKPSIKQTNKQLLIPVLKSLRKYFGMHNYVWKAEMQKNGMPHYHLTTDVFIPWESLRKIWNRLLTKQGYMHEFNLRHPGKIANSVDCKKVARIKNLAAYLAKYFSKDGNEICEDGTRIWGLSTSLSDAIKTKTFILPEEIEDISKLMDRSTNFYCQHSGTEVRYIKSSFWQSRKRTRLHHVLESTCSQLSHTLPLAPAHF